ncbi:Uridylate kinase [Hordeum vulgare]|nr:Uridylate kinase [Hordeum vulgare]
MACWNNEESLDKDMCMVSMDSQLFETTDSVVDPSSCGSFTESEPTCMMHHQRPKKIVAFECTLTRRRFLGYHVQQAKIDISMENLKAAKEQRCILQSQADIIQNMRKVMKELEGYMDLLKEEKKKLEYQIADLLKAKHGSKDKMESIKEIMDG